MKFKKLQGDSHREPRQPLRLVFGTLLLGAVVMLGPPIASALTISATAVRGTETSLPGNFKQVGDFLIDENVPTPIGTIDNGKDETTSWTFDYTGFGLTLTGFDITSAFLELELVIGSTPWIATDHFNLGVPGDYVGLGLIGDFPGFPYFSTVFTDLISGGAGSGDTVFVSLELLDFYSGGDVWNLYQTTGGLVGAVFSDDATVNTATLT
ncbi:MAG: hypothetical protein IH977_11705 [Nitrospinae bacterium]|nr:hypothetical protein [Nitrospinota bacterium]